MIKRRRSKAGVFPTLLCVFWVLTGCDRYRPGFLAIPGVDTSTANTGTFISTGEMGKGYGDPAL
jgi:hypothetical protein